MDPRGALTLRYSIEPCRSGKSMQIAWTMLNQCCQDFAGFALMANFPSAPTREDPGMELCRWQPNGELREGTLTLRKKFSIVGLQDKRWPNFYAKLMLLKADEIDRILVIHPDISIPFSPTGRTLPRHTCTPLIKQWRSAPPQSIFCPICQRAFAKNDLRFATADSRQAFPGTYTFIDRLLGRPPKSPIDADGIPLTRKLCPNPEHHDLWPSAGESECLAVGIVGSMNSGKSTYIASLIRQLQDYVGKDFGFRISPADTATETRYREEYWEPFWREKMQIQMTVGVPPPLLFDLILEGNRRHGGRDRTITLIFYDPAGTSFDSTECVDRWCPFLRTASGILFLFDPEQSDAIRSKLPSLGDFWKDRYDPTTTAIIRAISVLEDTSPPIPIACIVNKMDLLRDGGLLEPHRLWSKDWRHIGRYDLSAHDDMSGMMSEQFQQMDKNAYNNIRTHCPKHAFFGVSSTGGNWDFNTGRFNKISPWRVEDPLLWLLAMLGVLPISSHKRVTCLD